MPSLTCKYSQIPITNLSESKTKISVKDVSYRCLDDLSKTTVGWKAPNCRFNYMQDSKKNDGVGLQYAL